MISLVQKLRLMLDKSTHHLHTHAAGCKVPGSSPSNILAASISSICQEQGHDLFFPSLACQMQRGLEQAIS